MTGVAKIHQGLACEGAMTDNEIKACKSLLLKLGDDDDSNDEEPEEIRVGTLDTNINILLDNTTNKTRRYRSRHTRFHIPLYVPICKSPL